MRFVPEEEILRGLAEEEARRKASGYVPPYDPDANPFPWLQFDTVDKLPTKEPPKIIDGFLHLGEKLGITAGSKSFKTWLLLHLAYAISNGLPFLGFETTKAKVVYFDLELTKYGIRRRLERIRAALGVGNFENLRVCSLRGQARKFCECFQQIGIEVRCEMFEVVIIDPVYKFLLGRNETDNALVADMLEGMTAFCDYNDVAMIWVHHHSKGNQAGKDSLDRSSGAGSWSRDPDALLDLVDHKDSTKTDRIFTAEVTVREFKPVDKFVVRWDFPLLVRDTRGLDPEELKRPRGRPATYTVGDLIDQLGGDELTTNEFQKRMKDQTCMSPTRFYELLKEAEKTHLIFKSTLSQKWEKIQPN